MWSGFTAMAITAVVDQRPYEMASGNHWVLIWPCTPLQRVWQLWCQALWIQDENKKEKRTAPADNGSLLWHCGNK
jgi:hypothetical protein